ncbi:MAG: DUF6279 family lipoprotein [Halieaceae bacterium]
MRGRSVPGRCRWIPVLLLVFLTACSSTTFVYNRLDFLLPWYLGDYVELERDQKKYLGSLLEPFLQWHRAEELPQYLQMLQDAESKLDGPLTAADIETISLSFEAAWLRLESRALEWLMELGEELSDEQINGFITELRDKQTEYEEKYLTRTDEEYHEEAYENLRDSLQDYMGRLDKDQRALLQDASLELQRSDGVWLTERAAWIDMLERVLQRQPGWQQALRDAIDSRDDTVSAAYSDTYAHNTAVIYGTLAETINSRSEKQDRRLRSEIRSLERDLETLIEQGRENEAKAAAAASASAAPSSAAPYT